MGAIKEDDVVADEGYLSSSTPPLMKAYVSPLILRALKLSLPFILCAAYLLFLKYIYIPDKFYPHAALMLFYFIPPAGKETIIPLGIASGFSWYLMAISMTVLDVLSCMFMVWNFDLICKAPVFGGWVAACVKAGTKLLNRFPLIAKISGLGLGLFVMLPFQGSGGIASPVLGKMIGMSSWSIAITVSVGSFLGSVLLAFGFYSAEQYLKIDPIFLFGGAVIIVVIMFIYRRLSQAEKEIKGS
ncbi:MAG: small multi-drug export protein [Methanomicrobiales archaeon]|jgi:hypothetical protein|nr:small multi-drug export protein [Methanomicrobiales archaeon]